MESDVEVSGLESGVCNGRRCGTDVEKGRIIFSDEVEEGTSEIGSKSRGYINIDFRPENGEWILVVLITGHPC